MVNFTSATTAGS